MLLVGALAATGCLLGGAGVGVGRFGRLPRGDALSEASASIRCCLAVFVFRTKRSVAADAFDRLHGGSQRRALLPKRWWYQQTELSGYVGVGGRDGRGV